MVFKFRLERVLDLRKDELKEAQKKLAEAFSALELAKRKLKEAQDALKTAQDDLIKDEYKMAQDHLRHIRSCDENVQNRVIKLKDAEEGVVRAREALLQAQIKVEAMEKLKEKQLEEYLDAENKAEQKKYDEDAAIKHARKGMGDQHGLGSLDLSSD